MKNKLNSGVKMSCEPKQEAIDIVSEMSDNKVRQVLHLNFGIVVSQWGLNLAQARELLTFRIFNQLDLEDLQLSTEEVA